MRSTLIGALWRLTAFTMVGAMGTLVLLMIFGQLRFRSETPYRAEFTDVSGLQAGDFVRIAGVEVGKVTGVAVKPDNLALVEFTADDSTHLTRGTKAMVRWDNIIGGRYLELSEGAGDLQRLQPGQTIPADRTQPALDLDSLIGGFRPLFRSLDPEQLNSLTGQLIQALQGQGPAIGSLLAQTASLTNTVAERDQLIGEVITNLNAVLGSLSEQSGQFAKSVDSLSALVEGLAAQKGAIAESVVNINTAAGTIAEFLVQGRPPLKEFVAQTDRAATLAVSDHEYLDNLLNTLPEAYQALSRQGIYGDFFSFYVCDLVLKLNGKGGQPVYVKVAGQDSGRCAPK